MEEAITMFSSVFTTHWETWDPNISPTSELERLGKKESYSFKHWGHLCLGAGWKFLFQVSGCLGPTTISPSILTSPLG